ncbi:MAG: hypothetical protein V4493_08895, partial [Pseudomonadota bacterium]
RLSRFANESSLKISSSASDAALLQLIEVVESHCPVMDILARAQTITGKAIVNGKELHAYPNEQVLAA